MADAEGETGDGREGAETGIAVDEGENNDDVASDEERRRLGQGEGWRGETKGLVQREGSRETEGVKGSTQLSMQADESEKVDEGVGFETANVEADMRDTPQIFTPDAKRPNTSGGLGQSKGKGKQIEWIMAKPKSAMERLPKRPNTATGKHSAQAMERKQAEWDSAKRRDWFSTVPVSTKPNPPRPAWGKEQRPFQKEMEKDLRRGVSSSGLSWSDVGALNATRRLHSPATIFRTEPRPGALTREQERIANDTPGPDVYSPESLHRIFSKNRPGAGFTHGTRETPVCVYSKRNGEVVATYGESSVSDESGLVYSSLGKQPLADRRSASVCKFGTAKRRGLATLNAGPGPCDYAVKLSMTESNKDVVYKTKFATQPKFLFTKNKRPWQTIDYRIKYAMTFGTVPPLGAPQVLTKNITAPRAKFGTAQRHGTHAEHDQRNATPGPGQYAS